MTNLESILKSKAITLPTKVYIVKAMVFLGIICMWELNHKEVWALKNWFLLIMVLEKTWESLGLQGGANQSILKNINPECSLGGRMLKLKLQYFGHQMQRANSFKKTLMPGKIKDKRSGWQNEIVGWPHRINGHESEHTPGESEEQRSLECCIPWGHKVRHDLVMEEQQHRSSWHSWRAD